MEDEMIALKAIYGDDSVENRGEGVVWMNVPGMETDGIRFKIKLPEGYPDEESSRDSAGDKLEEGSVQIRVIAPWLKGNEEARVAAAGRLAWLAAGSGPRLFDVAEAVREAAAEIHHERMVLLEEAQVKKLASKLVIYDSEELRDRRSRFIGHAASIQSRDDVQRFLDQLLCDRREAKATHHIYAWRYQSASGGTLDEGCDDGGERGAGPGLLYLLQEQDWRNAAVVVTRWYGGVQLGPDRFRWINQAAKLALQRLKS